MTQKQSNPNANVPKQTPDQPLGDRGHGDKTWAPAEGAQGISNRPDDESARRQTGGHTDPSSDETLDAAPDEEDDDFEDDEPSDEEDDEDVDENENQ